MLAVLVGIVLFRSFPCHATRTPGEVCLTRALSESSHVQNCGNAHHHHTLSYMRTDMDTNTNTQVLHTETRHTNQIHTRIRPPSNPPPPPIYPRNPPPPPPAPMHACTQHAHTYTHAPVTISSSPVSGVPELSVVPCRIKIGTGPALCNPRIMN